MKTILVPLFTTLVDLLRSPTPLESLEMIMERISSLSVHVVGIR